MFILDGELHKTMIYRQAGQQKKQQGGDTGTQSKIRQSQVRAIQKRDSNRKLSGFLERLHYGLPGKSP